MRKLLLSILAISMPAVAQAEMTVGTFIAKADALQAKGVLAMMSSDIGLLKKEMVVVTTNYRAEIKAARAAGKTPHSCPPSKGSMDSDVLISHFRTLPANTGLKAGFYNLMKKKYPCATQ